MGEEESVEDEKVMEPGTCRLEKTVKIYAQTFQLENMVGGEVLVNEALLFR